MARITIDDCLQIIPNRFDLTLAAAFRARQLSNGALPMVEADRDKATVIALREMAGGKFGIEILARNRTNPRSVPADAPAGVTAQEDTWRWITETGGDAAHEQKVPAEPAIAV